MTKSGEYSRSAELFVEICQREEYGPYFALSMLLDSQYERADLLAIREKMEIRMRQGV